MKPFFFKRKIINFYYVFNLFGKDFLAMSQVCISKVDLVKNTIIFSSLSSLIRDRDFCIDLTSLNMI